MDDIKLDSEGLSIIPQETREKGTKEIIQFIIDLYRSPNADPLYRTKLMVVGFQEIGKTTLIDCLFPLHY